jgi:hypothetical protein
MSLDLFGAAPDKCSGEFLEWRASGDARNKLNRRFRLYQAGVDAGVTVIHCGHPTAHRPWYFEIDGMEWERRAYPLLPVAKAAALTAYLKRNHA